MWTCASGFYGLGENLHSTQKKQKQKQKHYISKEISEIMLWDQCL